MATYYVDGVGGNDSTGNGTSGNPWKTLGKGYAMLNAGDTLRARTATYREQMSITKNGVTIENDAGHTPTIDGTCTNSLGLRRPTRTAATGSSPGCGQR